LINNLSYVEQGHLIIVDESNQKKSYSNYINNLNNNYLVVDHISRCSYDSTLFNNRICTENFNNFNSSLGSNNTSGKF
jgi:hypothetical protein